MRRGRLVFPIRNRLSPHGVRVPNLKQRTALRLWGRLNPTAPKSLDPTRSPTVWLMGRAPRGILIGVVSSCDTGPLFMRKGHHALNTRSSTERSAQCPSIDVVSPGPHAHA